MNTLLHEMEAKENEQKIYVGQYLVHTADAGEHTNPASEYCEIRPTDP